MVTHWESSKRPLYIKTVWKDGQRRIVDKEEAGTRRPNLTHRSSSSSSKRARNQTKSAKSESDISFKIPSVKLLLDKFDRYGAKTKSATVKEDAVEEFNPCGLFKTAVTFDIMPTVPIRFNNLNKQVTFNERPEPVKKLPGSKAAGFDINKRLLNCVDDSQTYISDELKKFDQFNTSLTEKVMIWLDLAVQKEKEFKDIEVRNVNCKRVETAEPKQGLQSNNSRKYNKLNAFERSIQRYKLDEVKTEENEIMTLNKAKINESGVVTRLEERERSHIFAPLITSRVECKQIDESNGIKRVKVRADTAKRQLHIFLPNIPKKSNESVSLISGKSSSLIPTV